MLSLWSLAGRQEISRRSCSQKKKKNRAISRRAFSSTRRNQTGTRHGGSNRRRVPKTQNPSQPPLPLSRRPPPWRRLPLPRGPAQRGSGGGADRRHATEWGRATSSAPGWAYAAAAAAPRARGNTSTSSSPSRARSSRSKGHPLTTSASVSVNFSSFHPVARNFSYPVIMLLCSVELVGSVMEDCVLLVYYD